MEKYGIEKEKDENTEDEPPEVSDLTVMSKKGSFLGSRRIKEKCNHPFEDRVRENDIEFCQKCEKYI